ncbi:hypothetical protein POM88_010961 [Heracleum sosnowskyi]|uniref:CCHC-type domain-containing protein n=1 Tax=Heracleum sosnowskyi TaxID=360622 RepID=A0AAD8MW60_9APIA|nr:hypothetical protein POM88_010961 [Heracleum sosnowskyi]
MSSTHNYPNYIPAAMFYSSSPGYHLQFQAYPHYPANYLMPVSQDYNYSYYPYNSFADSHHYYMNHYPPESSRIRSIRYYDADAEPEPEPEPYSLRVFAHGEDMSPPDAPETRLRVIVANGRRRVIGFRDADTSTSLRNRINRFNVPEDLRWIIRNPSRFRGLADRESETRRYEDGQTTAPSRKRTRKFSVRKPLQVSNFPKSKRKWTSRDPCHFQAFSVKKRQKRKRLPPSVAESSLEVPNFPKRRWTSGNPSQFRAFPRRKRKRLPPWIAPGESSLQVPAFQKRRSKRLASRVALGESSLQVPAFQKRQSKRLASRVALGESSSQVPAFQKRQGKRLASRAARREPFLKVPSFKKRRNHKFRKWFPLRMSNQWIQRSYRSYACFICKKLGHFAIRCPQNMANKSRPFSSVPVFVEEDGLEYAPPTLLCQCGLRCSLGTRKKTSRKVYTCPFKSCKTFRWEDEVKKDELISVPKCQCGAGFCRQYTESGGTEVGRKYFACPIKKGQGACTFFKWLNDESLTNSRCVDERISPLKFTIESVNNVQKVIRSNILDTVGKYPNQREISGNREVELMEMDGHEEETSNKTPRKCNKRLQDGARKYDSSFSNTVVELVTPQSFSDGEDTEGVVHVRKSMCLRQTSIEENALAARTTSNSCSYTSDLLPLREDWLRTAAMNLNIELFKGWWGRLAYPPAPCLKLPEAKPFYCCVFPSFAPIFVPQIVDEVDSQSRNCQNPYKNIEGSLMFGSISDQFARVARDLQNKLISLLKSSDFRSHDYMAREANITFTALDQLQVQSQPFCERVNKLIRSASILDKAEGFIILKDQSYNDYQGHYYSKKRKRNDVISDFDVAKASCEAENKYHEARCAQTCVDLIESEKRLEVAEEDLRLLQQKKEEYNTAEVAYKKARIELGI